jgi:hypothetical protein
VGTQKAVHVCRGRLPREANILSTWPVMATMGTESSSASARPVTKLVAPGPDVAMHTPTSPVTLPYPSAAKISPCNEMKQINYGSGFQRLYPSAANIIPCTGQTGCLQTQHMTAPSDCREVLLRCHLQHNILQSRELSI